MKQIVRTKAGYDPADFDYPVSSYSETVPDQSLSVREILIRFTRGLPPPGIARPAVYDDEGDNENFFDVDPIMRQDMDISDVDTYKDEYEHRQSLIERAKQAAKKVVGGAKESEPKTPEEE